MRRGCGVGESNNLRCVRNDGVRDGKRWKKVEKVVGK